MNNYFKKKNEQMLFEEASSFKDFFQMPFLRPENSLKTDIIENPNSYLLIMDIPGCNKDDVKIANEEGYLTVTVNATCDNTSNNYLKKERMHGTYSRSYYIGSNIDSKDISATFSNGLLQVTFPKEKSNTSTTYIAIKDK